MKQRLGVERQKVKGTKHWTALEEITRRGQANLFW
jgi:hypothetical protein